MRPRLANIDFYEGKFEKHANGCRVAKAACTKYAAYAQKWHAQREKPECQKKEASCQH